MLIESVIDNLPIAFPVYFRIFALQLFLLVVF